MKWLLYRFRPINLIIVILTQLFFLHTIVFPFYDAQRIVFDPQWQYYIIIAITLIVCAAGYIINDILDSDIDKVNKSHKVIHQPAKWLRIYWILFILGFGLTSILSYLHQHIYFLFIFLASFATMYGYSRFLKCTALWGNIIVASFSAGVVLVLVGPEFSDLISIENVGSSELIRPFTYYVGFAFMVSLVRELIKDMEDLPGDESQSCGTLVVKAGIARTTIYVQFLIVCTIVSLLSWQYLFWDSYSLFSMFYLFLAVILPLMASLFLLQNVYKKGVGRSPKVDELRRKGYHRISSLYKIIMLLGIFFLLTEW